MDNINQINEIKRLKWACRRGMLELDLLLGPFLEHGYHHLTANQQTLFQRLLVCEDQDLYNWLIANGEAPDVALVELKDIILQYARL